MKINDLKNKKIIILGLGREGLASLRFIEKYLPGEKVAVADQVGEEKVSDEVKDFIGKGIISGTFFGENYLDHLSEYEVIIKSPGVFPHQPQLEKAYEQGRDIISGTSIFMDNCPGKVIGVTGTKGKSTTTSVIFEVLKIGGLKVRMVGNIGIPALDYLSQGDKDTIFVFEMSSHQLQDLKVSPHIGVMTNIYPEHMDYYQGFEEYKEAKVNITRFQTQEDFFIYNQGEHELLDIAEHTLAQKIPFNLKKQTGAVVFKDGMSVYWNGEKIIDQKEVPLIGEFNLQNIMPAIIIGKIFNLSASKIKEGLKNSKPLTHRLEMVGTYQGVTFYNDSISTIPQAAVVALGALGSSVETLIAGGYDRNIDFLLLAQALQSSQVKSLILFPTTGEKIWESVCMLMEKKDRPDKIDVLNMKDAVREAYKVTSNGKICLLSPASTSFNLFKDYEDRGDQFKKYIKEYGLKTP